jgi:hypothetical protein
MRNIVAEGEQAGGVPTYLWPVSHVFRCGCTHLSAVSLKYMRAINI